jgi:steroid delta-isomerase
VVERETIEATIERYMTAMTAGDRDGWVGCFAEGGTLEDPVGSDVLTGKEEIGTFFDNAHAMANGIAMARTGPIRVAADHGAFPFTITTTLGEDTFSMPVIDVMTFDDDGHITTMRAFWDMADMTPVE